MIQEKLKQIDTKLVQLLGTRIAVLAESKPSSLREQLSSITPLLAQVGVPEFVWQNLAEYKKHKAVMGSAHPTRNAFYFIAGVIVTSCAAAIATQSSPPATVSSRRVTVIGGRGTMGSFFTQYLSAAGHHVMILEQEDWDDADKLLARAELVLVCVPIQCTLDVICKAARYLAPTTALADMTSIKTPVIQTMLEQHRGPVMGLHPMFGPGVQSFLSQKVIVCPGRGDSAFQWLLDFIESEGGRLIVCTPEEHDQMMIAVQAIRHFSTFGLGVFLAEEGIDICRSLNFASPSYRLELGLITRLFAQHAPLCIDIMLATEERCRAIERLADTYNRLANLIMQKDRDTLIHEFAVARSTFGEELSCSLEASTHVINAFSTCLAANKVEQEHSAIARTRSTKISSLSHSYDAQVKPKEPAQL